MSEETKTTTETLNPQMVVMREFQGASTKKPGWQTTEFYMTLGTVAITALVIFGYVPQSDADWLKSSLTDVIEKSVALLASAMVIWKYISSRTQVKSE